jgi:uncharacterized membrane protein
MTIDAQTNDDAETPEAPTKSRATLDSDDGKRVVCAISQKDTARRKTTSLGSLRPTLVDRIRTDHPDLDPDARIALAEVGRYRSRIVEEMLTTERGEMSDLDRRVAESLERHEMIAENVEEEYHDQRTIGERLSDRLASFGGSWAFLISFGAFLAAWMAFNVYQGEKAAFDAYPFILLNLILSSIAAVQAPIIMMSQKRTEDKDRLRSENDYKVNLKAELEIRHLHEKIDHLLTKQWERLVELQQLQLEALQETKRKSQ